MTPVEKILNADLSVGSLETSLKAIEERIGNIIDEINQKIDFQNKLLGANLKRILTYNLNDFIIYQDGKYIINPLIKAKLNAINVKSSDVPQHADVLNVLNDFLPKDYTFTEPVKKTSPLSNALTKKELSTIASVLIKGSQNILFLKDLKTQMKGPITDNTIVNKKFFKNNFYTKDTIAQSLKMKVKNGDNTDINAFDKIYFNNCSFKELRLNYSLTELEGSGCKLSDFNETQAAQSPTPAIVDVMVLFMSPMELSLEINGNTYSYTPDMENDTLDVVADSLGSAVDIDGVSYELKDGYYSATPKDDDGDYKLGWYVLDTKEGASYSVQLTSDNSSEHDLTVSYDDSNGKLIVTYASDGSDTLPPTISELMDAVNNSDTPFRVAIADESVASPDDDYPYEMEFSLDQTTSLIEFTSTNEDISVTGNPTQVFEINKTQDFVAGKHQEGYVECITFRRGYKYYIKIDDKEIGIDTTDNNNPNVTSANQLMEAFANQINNQNLSFQAVNVNNKLTLASTDYTEHTITTSGAIDYTEPLPRDFRVLNDVKMLVRQGSEATLYKPTKTLLEDVKELSPITKTDLDYYKEQGLFATSNKISNLKVSDESFVLNEKLPRVIDASRKIYNLISQNKDFFVSGKVEYISKYDLFIPSRLNFPSKMELEKWGILQEYEYTFVPQVQIEFLKEIPIKDLQEKMFGWDDVYFTKELNAVGKYIATKGIVTYKELTKNINDIQNIEKPFYIQKPDISKALNPLFPFISPFNIEDEEGKDLIQKAQQFLDPRFDDYESLDLFNHPYVKNDDDKKRALAHTLFALVLVQNSPNILPQLIYLLENYRFTLDDIRFHLEDETLRNTVLDFSTQDDAVPEPTYGLDGETTEGAITFSNLYIREYKSAIKKENESTIARDYLKANFVNAPLPEKLLLCLPGNLKVDSSINLEPYSNLEIRIHSIYDDMIYRDNVKNAYFPHNSDFLISKAGSGLTQYNDTTWGLLMRAIHFKDENTIISVSDAWSTIKLLYSKYTQIDKWELALFLSPAVKEFNNMGRVDNTYDKYETLTETSALLTLCSKIYAYLKMNNVAAADYESTFNKLVGLLFANDNTKTDILPYEIFQLFLAYNKELDYTINAEQGIFIPYYIEFKNNIFYVKESAPSS